MIHADRELAQRLERAAAAQGHDAVRAHRGLFKHSEAASLPFGGGVAVFLDEQSPMTAVRGAGASGAVSETEVEELEAFFEERIAPVTVVLTPFADDALVTRLVRRGYEFGSFENTLVREVGEADLGPREDAAPAEDPEEWSRMMAESFFGEVTAMGMELGQTLFAMPECRNLIVRAGEAPAAGAQLDIRDGLAVLQCDGTLPPYRGVGLQSMLIRARLAMAAAAGCDLATADTAPGSQSQRNYERLGFRVAYTRVTLLKPCF